jgi:hypothetical protein
MLDELEPLIERAMAEWKVPGLTIAVVHEDAPILALDSIHPLEHGPPFA